MVNKIMNVRFSATQQNYASKQQLAFSMNAKERVGILLQVAHAIEPKFKSGPVSMEAVDTAIQGLKAEKPALWTQVEGLKKEVAGDLSKEYHGHYERPFGIPSETVWQRTSNRVAAVTSKLVEYLSGGKGLATGNELDGVNVFSRTPLKIMTSDGPGLSSKQIEGLKAQFKEEGKFSDVLEKGVKAHTEGTFYPEYVNTPGAVKGINEKLNHELARPISYEESNPAFKRNDFSEAIKIRKGRPVYSTHNDSFFDHWPT